MTTLLVPSSKPRSLGDLLDNLGGIAPQRVLLPGGRVPTDPIPDLVPELLVEVLSPGNTSAEMSRKLQEYFTAGVCLVWLIDPATRTVRVYTDTASCRSFDESGSLDGGDVLPGFQLTLREVFAELDRRPT